MNKLQKITIAIFGAMDVVVYIATPILLVLLYGKVFGFNSWGSYLFYGVGLCAGLFRAIKIGWFEK